MASASAERLASLSRSPMWGVAWALPPSATAAVTWRCPPTARTGVGVATGSPTGSGTHPRARRIRIGPPPVDRMTESSTRRATSRSWSSSASAMAPRRSRASRLPRQMGSSEALPEVATSGRPTPAMSSSWRGVVGSSRPRSSSPGASPSASGASRRRRPRTMGARGDSMNWRSASVRSARASAWVRSATMTAKGLVGRCLRRRRRATAASSSARHASWNPPRPLTATMCPLSTDCTAASTASGPSAAVVPWTSTSHRRGPQAGQHTGSAWNRRSAVSSYSRWQAAHSGKQAMVVRARS
jgi:hypothetical protein